MAISDATAQDLNGPGSNSNEGLLRIPQSSSITGALPSDCLILYPGYSAEMQSVYSIAAADLAKYLISILKIW